MGFCLINHVAVAAAAARARGVARVAIVDYDVHHGNGTEAIFYEDASVLYVSTHQFPFYPGTGAAGDVGRGAGAGRTVNIPLRAGAEDADYDAVFRAIVMPVLRRFEPGLILVSAGFDAHERDPLAGMRMTVDGYVGVTRLLCEEADALCGGRLALVTEGGYDLPTLRACLDAVLETAGEPSLRLSDRSTADLAAPPRAVEAIRAVRAAQAPFWPEL